MPLSYRQTNSSRYTVNGRGVNGYVRFTDTASATATIEIPAPLLSARKLAPLLMQSPDESIKIRGVAWPALRKAGRLELVSH